MTLALKTLGYKVVSPPEAIMTTEVMLTWKELATQRIRWKRGAIEDLCHYGLTRHTLKGWGLQAVSVLGILATLIYAGTLLASPWLGFHIHWLFIGFTGIYALERAVTVRERGWRVALLSMTVIGEWVFDIFLQMSQSGPSITRSAVLMGSGDNEIFSSKHRHQPPRRDVCSPSGVRAGRRRIRHAAPAAPAPLDTRAAARGQDHFCHTARRRGTGIRRDIRWPGQPATYTACAVHPVINRRRFIISSALALASVIVGGNVPQTTSTMTSTARPVPRRIPPNGPTTSVPGRITASCKRTQIPGRTHTLTGPATWLSSRRKRRVVSSARLRR